MQTTEVISEKGTVSVIDGLTQPLRTGGDLLDVLMNSPSDTVALEAGDLDARFFDLKSGIAGDMLQKVSNYQRRLIILGDFTDVTSQSLRDFIYESNQQGRVIFAATLAEALSRLK